MDINAHRSVSSFSSHRVNTAVVDLFSLIVILFRNHSELRKTLCVNGCGVLFSSHCIGFCCCCCSGGSSSSGGGGVVARS